MKYKIHTIPIIDAFKTDCECPMCLIEKQTSDTLVEQYLNEAVMEPSYRIDVNKHGFCSRHFADLWNGDNACGVALQCSTRMQTLKNSLVRPLNAKQAKKESERITKQLSSCVICRQVDEIMERYYQTVAKMYCYEKDFDSYIRSGKGFCIKHYAKLLEFADFAESAAPRYVDLLYNRQFANFNRLDSELQSFIDLFDSNSKNKNNPDAKDSVPRVIDKIKGL